MYGSVEYADGTTRVHDVRISKTGVTRKHYLSTAGICFLVVTCLVALQFSQQIRAGISPNIPFIVLQEIYGRRHEHHKEEIESSPSIEAHLDFDFKTSNEYTSREPSIGSEYRWITAHHFMEPYRVTTFNVTDPRVGTKYTWLVTAPSYAAENDTNLQGFAVEYVCKHPGEYNVTLREWDVWTWKIFRKMSASVQCRYVRREVRSLAPRDQEAFLNAMVTIYRMDVEMAYSLYGSNFAPISDFVKAHNVLAGDRICDHLHDGYGFLTQHSGLSRWFEYVLQLVDPMIALPYWDYTFEGQLFSVTKDMSIWRDSLLFSDEWFGSVNDNFEVKTGRFAYTTVAWNAHNISNTANAYGFMRAPWNQNNVPYITRFNSSYGFTFTAAPDCEAHMKVLLYNNWMDFGREIMYSPHGPMHIMIGGVGNSNWMNKLKALDYRMSDAMYWAPSGFSLQKNMYRSGWLNCPDTCSLDTPTTECRCVCKNISKWTNMTETELLAGPMTKLFPNAASMLYNQKGEFIGREIIRLLCNEYDMDAPIFGDSIESSSPNDPTFWNIHPTVERLLIWRRILGLKNTTWPSNKAWSVDGFKNGYCYGHNQDDVTTWPRYIFIGTGFEGPYTNADIFNLIDPNLDLTPYIYNNFKWKHCTSFGYDLTLVERSG